MIALVLTFDRNATIAEMMMAQYRRVWPNHPFVFHIPYQSDSRKLENWGEERMDRRRWVSAPQDIPGTMAALLNGLDEASWVYWCIDDKYPISLNRKVFRELVQFAPLQPPSALSGILPCRARQMLNPEKTGELLPTAPAGLPMLRRKTWDQIWLHQFLRAGVLRQLFDGMPAQIRQAREMDLFKWDVPLHPNLFVAAQNAVQFGESMDAGEVLLNAVLQFRQLSRPLPPHLPVRLSKSVVIGRMQPSTIDRLQRMTHKLLLAFLKKKWGSNRMAALIRAEAGWEIFQILHRAVPSGNFVFFDIGANNGSSAIAYCDWFPNAKGVLFEAHPAIAAVATRKVEEAGLAHRLTVQPLGLSNQNGAAEFHVSTASEDHDLVAKNPHRPRTEDHEVLMGSGSLLAPDRHLDMYPGLKFRQTETVQLSRADDWLATQDDVQPPTFLHIDTQGAELMVLAGFGDALAHVAAVWMEVSRVPLYTGQPLVPEVSTWMKAQGFALAVDAVGKAWGDQLWVRKRVWDQIQSTPALRLAQSSIDFQRIRSRRQPF